MAGMVKDDNNVKHRDVRDAERLRSEEYVQKTQQVICSFINPFDVDDKSTLVISSGAAVPPEISSDILHAERAGKAAYKDFVSSRLETGTNFFQAISRLRLKSFADLNKTRVKWLAFCQPQSRILGQQWVLKSINLLLSPARQSEVR